MKRRVLIREPREYTASVLIKGGEIREYPIGGNPFTGSPYNAKLDLVLRDGRTVALNWAEVILIEFTPTLWAKIPHEFEEDMADKMVASGNAEWEGGSKETSLA